MADAHKKTPWHLWLVGVVAVLFNAIGVFDFVMSVAEGAKYMAGAGMTPDQIAHYRDIAAVDDHRLGRRRVRGVPGVDPVAAARKIRPARLPRVAGGPSWSACSTPTC